LAQKPDLSDARFALGASLSEMDRLPEAIEQFRAYVAGHPDDVSALNNLALLYERTGEVTRARLMWLKVKDKTNDKIYIERAERHLTKLIYATDKRPAQKGGIETGSKGGADGGK